jgi:hypothetical protein
LEKKVNVVGTMNVLSAYSAYTTSPSYKLLSHKFMIKLLKELPMPLPEAALNLPVLHDWLIFI